MASSWRSASSASASSGPWPQRIGEPGAEAREHVQPVLVDRVQERAVGAAGAAREPRGDARDGGAVAGRRERLAGDVEQLRQAGVDARARARERERGLRGHVPQELALGLAERIGPRAQDLEHADRARPRRRSAAPARSSRRGSAGGARPRARARRRDRPRDRAWPPRGRRRAARSCRSARPRAPARRRARRARRARRGRCRGCARARRRRARARRRRAPAAPGRGRRRPRRRPPRPDRAPRAGRRGGARRRRRAPPRARGPRSRRCRRRARGPPRRAPRRRRGRRTRRRRWRGRRRAARTRARRSGPPSPSNGMSPESLAIAAPSFVSARAAKPLSARRCQRCTQPAPRPVLAAITSRPSGSRTATAAQSQASPSAVARLIASSTRSRSSATPASRLAAARTRSAMAARRRSEARCVVSSSAAAAVLTRSSTPPAAPSSASAASGGAPATWVPSSTKARCRAPTSETKLRPPWMQPATSRSSTSEENGRAVRIAQRALECLEGLLAARAHARERHALGRQHLVRDERAALQQRSAELRHQSKAGRLGLGSLVDHGAQHRAPGESCESL